MVWDFRKICKVMASYKIRPSRIDDCEEIFRMSEELNIHEKLPGSSEFVTVEALKRDGFGDGRFFNAIVVEADVLSNENTVEEHGNQRSRLLGYSLFSFTFATYGPGRVLSLIDMYVCEGNRRRGIGKSLFTEVARIALSRHCQEITWHAFSWNTEASNFYKKLGASNVTTELNLNSFSMDHKQMSFLTESGDMA